MVLRSETIGWFLGQRRRNNSLVSGDRVVLRSETTGWFLGKGHQQCSITSG
jgi:hypothetical protein